MYQLDIPNFKIYRSKKLKKKQTIATIDQSTVRFRACISSNLTEIINPRGVDQLERDSPCLEMEKNWQV